MPHRESSSAGTSMSPTWSRASRGTTTSRCTCTSPLHPPPDVSAALQLESVTFRRDTTEILHGIDLTVARGERWAMLGRNGCGKTTLLSIAGAREHPTSGTADVLGR